MKRGQGALQQGRDTHGEIEPCHMEVRLTRLGWGVKHGGMGGGVLRRPARVRGKLCHGAGVGAKSGGQGAFPRTGGRREHS